MNWSRVSAITVVALLMVVLRISPTLSLEKKGEDSVYIGAESCKQCHTDIYDAFKKSPHGKSVMDEKVQPGRKGCESCHGPGSKHVDAEGNGFIISFKKMDARDWSASCLKCHEKMKSFSQTGGSVHKLSAVACSDCHQIHGASTGKSLLSAKFVRWTTLSIIGLALFVLFIQFVNLYRISRSKDAVVYDNWSWRWALRSIFRWLIPFGTESMKSHPFVTLAYFSLHFAIFAILLSHIFLWRHPINAGWWSGSDRIAGASTLIFIASFLFIVIRRMVAPEVRIITTIGDYLLLALVVAIFISGYMAYVGLNYKNLLIFHILLGELLIILIPFTRLGHMILFFFTRAIIGVEFGARRGARTW